MRSRQNPRPHRGYFETMLDERGPGICEVPSNKADFWKYLLTIVPTCGKLLPSQQYVSRQFVHLQCTNDQTQNCRHMIVTVYRQVTVSIMQFTNIQQKFKMRHRFNRNIEINSTEHIRHIMLNQYRTGRQI